MSTDHQEILDVVIGYTWAIDTRRFDALATIFADDATADLRGVQCAGVQAIIDRIERPVSRLDVTQHLVGNHQIEIDGDTATHRCHLQSQHVKHGTPGGDNLLIGGIYEDRLVRTAAGWRISHRTMRETWREGNLQVIAH